jgi:hypothetical protein
MSLPAGADTWDPTPTLPTKNPSPVEKVASSPTTRTPSPSAAPGMTFQSPAM